MTLSTTTNQKTEATLTIRRRKTLCAREHMNSKTYVDVSEVHTSG